MDENLLLFACINGIIKAMEDPHSVFMSPSQYKDFMEKIEEKKYSGIGVRITRNDAGTGIKILEVFEDSPAKKAGITSGDVIININGKNISGMSLADVSDLMIGGENTPIELTLMRNNLKISVKLYRKSITVYAISGKILEPGIGYIKIESFKEDLDREFRKIYDQLERKNISGLIIDLRDNPGGLVKSARQLCGCILPGGSVVAEFRHRNSSLRSLMCMGSRVVFVPVIILVNEHSASSSEIVAGALQDHKAALILGKTTKGKGSVQRTTVLLNGGALKLTIERIFTPSGRLIDMKGIRPDVEVETSVIDKIKNKDTQLEKAVEIFKTNRDRIPSLIEETRQTGRISRNGLHRSDWCRLLFICGGRPCPQSG